MRHSWVPRAWSAWEKPRLWQGMWLVEFWLCNLRNANWLPSILQHKPPRDVLENKKCLSPIQTVPLRGVKRPPAETFIKRTISKTSEPWRDYETSIFCEHRLGLDAFTQSGDTLHSSSPRPYRHMPFWHSVNYYPSALTRLGNQREKRALWRSGEPWWIWFVLFFTPSVHFIH